MAEYVCKVGDPSGRIFEQVETAQSPTEAKQKLVDRGFYVFAVRTHFPLLARLTQSQVDRKIKSEDFLVFNQQFNTLIRAGSSLCDGHRRWRTRR
jgi:type IV pilus assembly protein PilC